jgi:hypothetical protein
MNTLIVYEHGRVFLLFADTHKRGFFSIFLVEFFFFFFFFTLGRLPELLPVPTQTLVSLLAVFLRARDRATSMRARDLFQRTCAAMGPAAAMAALVDITLQLATQSYV